MPGPIQSLLVLSPAADIDIQTERKSGPDLGRLIQILKQVTSKTSQNGLTADTAAKVLFHAGIVEYRVILKKSDTGLVDSLHPPVEKKVVFSRLKREKKEEGT